ncbi:MAG: LysR family transcriptional regulator, low CO2-responsive transcriptional regulator [Solirubrobacteraceae bacterium]|nr:LysR family transcriptional regulator, low CO2-responsive transcriptional regulator [Solirubrobacteraceae bacterium]MEA2299868.1 LysR family transcriptional regulator, low CO2-responsive transcriptional regulator [Solirubrobacteraceae bacterium]
MAITLTQLRSFLAVVHEGSTAAAAERLFVTQPSISAAVSALSQELGVKLTERVGRGVRPSPAGTAFTPYAADVIGLLDQGRRAAAEAAGQASRELRIAAVTTAAEYLVPTLMQAFGELHPEVVLALDVGNRDRVLRQLLEHEADIAIGGRPPEGDRMTGAAFMKNEIALIARPDHPLADGLEANLEQLGACTWLLREEGSGTRAMTEHYLEAQGMRPRVLTLGSNGAIKHAARAGLGIALQSRLAIELELEAGVLRTISVAAPLPHRDWYVLCSSIGPRRAHVEDFMAFVAGSTVQEILRTNRQNW